MYGHTYSKSMDQPGKQGCQSCSFVMNFSLSAFVPEILVSRDGFGSPVRRQPAYLHTPQAESGAFTYGIPPEFRGDVHIFIKKKRHTPSGHYDTGLSGHAISYRWRSLPRVRRHRASKPQGSSERVLPQQVTMDQLIYASLSHTHCWL